MSALPPPSPDSGYTPPPPPPGTAPYYPTGVTTIPVTGSFQRIGGLAKAMTVLLIILMAVQVIQIPVLIAVRTRSKDFLAGRISEATYEQTVNRQSGVAAPVGL